MVFSYPLMSVTQAISARIGSVTGCGIAQNLQRYYPPWVLRGAVILLLIANTANLGADLGAMGAAFRLLAGGPIVLYTAGFAVLCVLLEVFVSYGRYASILKWLTISLFAYVAVVFSVHIPWREALAGALLPALTLEPGKAEAVIAVLGTTISPYLFFWQASQEVEELHRRRMNPLLTQPARAGLELKRIETDTWTGMGFSNLISLFIIIATAATLHAGGIKDIQSSEQAAQALRPIAGNFAFAIFAAGIIGTGMLAVPVLAGSAAYAVSESFGWAEGLNRKPKNALAFYGVIAISTLTGLLLNFVGIDPINALYWSAILNGVLAAPLMALMLLIAANKEIMGELTLPIGMRAGGWLATAVMAAASVLFLLLQVWG